MKKAQKRFFGTALTLSTIASVVAPVAAFAAEQTYEDALAKVEAAKATPVFSLFNKAYEAVIALENADQKAVLLDELTPLWDKVNTEYVQDILAQLESLAKDKNLKTYHEVLAEIEANTAEAEALNKEYLKGELVAWAQSGALFTKDEQAAIDAIVDAWNEKTSESIQAAKDAIAKVTNAGSVEWLNDQLAELQATLKLTISDFKAVGEKTLKVEFNKPVEDTKKLTLTLKRDGANANVSEVEWNDAKTVATLTLGAKIIEADYQVVAKYDTEEEISSAVLSLEEAKVSKVEILSSKLTLSPSSLASDDDDAATFRIKVSNQYGEDITDDVDAGDFKVRASDGDWDNEIGDNGLITLLGDPEDNDDEFDTNSQVSVTVTYKPDSIVVTKTLTVAQAAAVASIEIGELTPYDSNDKDDRITSETDFADDYYFPLTVKDTDGNTLTYAELLDALDSASSSNDDVFNVLEADDDDVAFLGEDDDGNPIVKLANGDGESGKVVITVSSKSGVSATRTVEVEAAAGIDKLTFNTPDVTVKRGTDFVLTFNAYDQYGTQLVDESDFPRYKVEKDSNGRGGKVVFFDDENDEGTEIEVDGGTVSTRTNYSNNNALELVITPSANENDDEVVVSVDTVTGNRSEKKFAIKDAAYPESIGTAAITNRVVYDALGTPTVEVKRSTLSFKDQYGDNIILEGYQLVKINDLEYQLRKAGSEYGVVYKLEANKGFAIDSATLTGTDPKLVVKATDASKTAKLTVSLVKYTDVVEDVDDADVEETLDDNKITFESYALSDITGITIDNFDKVYVGEEFVNNLGATRGIANYAKDKEVFGLVKGNKVKLPGGLISSVSSTKTGIQASASGVKVKLTVTTAGDIDTDGADATAQVSILVKGADNKLFSLNKEYTYSDAAPKVTTFQVKDEYDTVLSGSNFTFEAEELDGLNVDTIIGDGQSKAAVRFFTKDQYGVEINGADIKVANFVDADRDNSFSPKITPDGRLDLEGAEAGDSFILSALTNDGQFKTITITLK